MVTARTQTPGCPGTATQVGSASLYPLTVWCRLEGRAVPISGPVATWTSWRRRVHEGGGGDARLPRLCKLCGCGCVGGGFKETSGRDEGTQRAPAWAWGPDLEEGPEASRAGCQLPWLRL